MSGPKVVRIVTREEIQAICRRHISMVAAAVREASMRAERCGKLDDALQRSFNSRVATLEEMLARSEWAAIQKQAPEIVSFLRSEGDRMEKSAIEHAAQAETRRRRSRDAARSIVTALKTAGMTLDPGLERAANGRSASLEEAERAVSAGLAAIPAAGRTKAETAASAELAARLGAGEQNRTVSDFLATQQGSSSPSDKRLDALLGELLVLGEAATTFVERADAIGIEESAARRRLLTDSLIMDAAAQVARVRKREAIDSGLRQAAASLGGTLTQEANAVRDRIAEAVGKSDESVANALLAQAASIVDANARALAAAARRRAVLRGLSTLGYEIRETMNTAWERDGRLVVRKPGSSDYGVELGAPADAARVQVRLVGSTTPQMPRDARRDADQEVIWCNDFDRLRADLGARGDEIIMEKAVEAGALPLRSVEMPRAAISVSADAAALPAAKSRAVQPR